MTKSSSAKVRPAGFFVLRSPLLPFRTLLDWAAGVSASSAPAGITDKAFEADERLLLARLREQVLRPEIREALFCASPSLDEAIDAWLADPGSSRAEGVTTILVRYLSRMAGRATPFGMFSSCALGRIDGTPTTLELGGLHDAVSRNTRLDMQYLSALIDLLDRDPELRSRLRYSPSSATYELAGRFHHIEAEYKGELRARTFNLVSFDASAALRAALDSARSWARPSEIAQAVRAADPEIDDVMAADFVNELIDAQVLVSELSPPITGVNPIRHVIEQLERCGAVPGLIRTLSEVRERLEALDASGLGASRSAYREIAKSLEQLPARVEISRLFQIDLTRGDGGLRLGRDVMAEIGRGLEIYRRIAVPREDPDLSSFRERFRERYESAEVPLWEALDEEVGVGFGSTSSIPTSLLEGLPFPVLRGSAPRAAVDRQTWMTRRILELAGNEPFRWELEERDLVALEEARDVEFPDSLQITAGVAQLGDGKLQIHLSGAGPHGAAMLGRFCYADGVLSAAVTDHLRDEEALSPDVIFAEIVHLPEGRMGNILCRPIFREYEIPFLGVSGAKRDKQITIDDLFVSVDTAGRVRLRSKRLGKWIEPRMTTAHNPLSTSLGLYRFLCALRSQGTMSFGFGWGEELFKMPRLPRVTAGALVLSPAQWFLRKEELAGISKVRGPARYRALQELRDRRALPRWVSVADGDNVLPVDLDNVLSCESFIELVKSRKGVGLTEIAPAPHELVATGGGDKYVAEIVVPFVSTRAPRGAAPITPVPVVQRKFAPGTEWLYAKLYTGQGTADHVLRDAIAPVAREALASGTVDQWFFIRYNDPQHHLRVRFHGNPAVIWERLAPALRERLRGFLDSGLVHRFILDTYGREIERYGGDHGIELAEQLFWIDSEIVLQAIELFDGETDPATRWRAALVGMDAILDGLELTSEERIQTMQLLRDGFAAEHGVDAAFERELGLRYRGHRKEIEGLLSGERVHRGVAVAAIEAVSRGKDRYRGVLREMTARFNRGDLTVPLGSLAGSFLHMHANRLLSSEQRAQELVLYDFLLRTYESRAARSRPRQP